VPDKYAVIGNPVAHSKSPFIHAQFARQTGEDIVYVPLLSPLEGFAQTVRTFSETGGRGANITVPFKRQAFELATRAQERAVRARAANVLTFERDGIVADNTDGIGLLRDLASNLGVELKGRRLLLMGAGGAAWGVVGPLLDAAPAELAIVNRTVKNAQRLVREFAAALQAKTLMQAYAYEALVGRCYDVIINATSAGLQGMMLPLPEAIFAPDALAYDMVYGRNTPFLQFAHARGIRAVDGIGMLVEQAAESFYLWRGVRPATAPVIARLRREA
jgi:shikimate dehydrogenase